MKGVLVLEDWINEAKMEDLENNWNVQPGDVRSRVDLAEWLLYAMREILNDDDELRKLDPSQHKILVDLVSELHRRISHGCKSDLLGLVSIRGIGRSRAREMVDLLGVENASDVAALTERDRDKLASLRGWSSRLVDNLVDAASRKLDDNYELNNSSIRPHRKAWLRTIEYHGSPLGEFNFLSH